MELIVIFKAIILGIIEGLTEYLPVSSTGHLIIFGETLKFNSVPDKIFETSIQFGAIMAVLVLYRVKVIKLIKNFYRRSPEQYFCINLMIAFLPAAIIGIMIHDFIKQHLFTSPVVALTLIFGGVVMILVDRTKLPEKTKELEMVTTKQALSIGLFQCLSMIPGMSRSGATIIGGMFSGLSRSAAAEFSFFLAIPTIFGASAYDLFKNRDVLSSDHLGLISIGFFVSFIVALFIVSHFIELNKKFGFTPFGIYRIILGLIILLFI